MPENEDQIAPPEIIRLHDALSEDLIELLSLAKGVQERLKPVLRGDIEGASGSAAASIKESGPSTVMGQKVYDARISVKYVIEQMRNILIHIEI